jgi:HAD superfamily hydrolase (TIGR01549 family)
VDNHNTRNNAVPEIDPINHNFKAVLFDLGDTLMYSTEPWPPVYEQAGRKLSDVLCLIDSGIQCETFSSDFLRKLDEYYTDRDRNLLETSTMTLLKQLLKETGIQELPDSLLRGALDEFYAITQKNWKLEADAIPLLESLKSRGLHLGLISNAGDNRDVFQLVERFNIEHYFDFILTSAACGYRKPHPRIFELALTHWGYMPDEIAMVGDRLDADIGGAGPLGFYTIWVKRRAKKPQIPRFAPKPDAEVDNLGEITSIMINLAQKKHGNP